jgi:hypothetical protein
MMKNMGLKAALGSELKVANGQKIVTLQHHILANSMP